MLHLWNRQNGTSQRDIARKYCYALIGKMMWTVMMLITVLYTPAVHTQTSGQCDTETNTTLFWSQVSSCSDIQLSGQGIDRIESKGSRSDQLTKLDISSNKLTELPEDFLSYAPLLQEIHLEGNNLKRLPKMFLENSTNLQIFRAEGNPLSEIPPSIFHGSLVNLTVECQCQLVSNIMTRFNGSFSAMCQTDSEWITLEAYHQRCGKGYLALYIVLPMLVIGLIIGGVALYIWKWKRSSTTLENKSAADKSPAHVQSRYTSRNSEGTATSASPGQRQDYENVFVGHQRTTEAKPHGYLEDEPELGRHGNNIPEDDIYLESDVNESDQPIYSNTQGIYYNYSQQDFTKSKEEDNVYILPDQ
ncbi:leucine-rich repeat-containing protein 25 isoform X2 [Eleutherodactylus coqui]|uniref:leucine-rich repeat-containing protein 25 isoform X2 n=1 Tax=Eleutherodactylus coqui TaxID=57060 RepID=UPI003462D110